MSQHLLRAICDDEITLEVELVHFALLGDIELLNYEEDIKEKFWREAMI